MPRLIRLLPSLARLLCILPIVLALVLQPQLADARAGSGSSMGSRGGRTWSAPPSTGAIPGGASGFDRSTTVPNGVPNSGAGNYGGGYGGGYGRGGFGTGLLGGLVGFGLGSALFGHRGYGVGGGGLGILGVLLRIVIVFFLVRFVLRWLFRRRGAPAAAGGGLFGSLFAPRSAAYGGQPGYAAPQMGGYGGQPSAAGGSVSLQPSDYAAFEVLLKNIQAAWSNNDLEALRQFASPEMVSYFAEQLADNASRGVRNVIGQVQLDKGDLSEAWTENGRIYATVAMRFSMTDATYDQAGRLVAGNATQPVAAAEYWTFLRATGGRWMLSAIQQGR